MAVGLLCDRKTVVVLNGVEKQAAVATLVRLGYVLQYNPEAVVSVSKVQSWWQGVVVVIDAAWSQPRFAVLVSIGCVKPDTPQDISGVQGFASLDTLQFGRGSLGADVEEVGCRDGQGGVGVRHLTSSGGK